MAMAMPPVNPAMMGSPQIMMAAMTPKASDLVMTYPRTPVPPPFQSGGLPEGLWEQTWDKVHAQVVAEMEQAEQQAQTFTSNMPSMNPLSMFISMFKGLCGCASSMGSDPMSMMNDAMAAAANNQQTWLTMQADAAAAFATYKIGVVLATEQRYHHSTMHGHSYTVTVGLAFNSDGV